MAQRQEQPSNYGLYSALPIVKGRKYWVKPKKMGNDWGYGAPSQANTHPGGQAPLPSFIPGRINEMGIRPSWEKQKRARELGSTERQKVLGTP